MNKKKMAARKLIIFGGRGKFGRKIIDSIDKDMESIVNMSDNQRNKSNFNTIFYKTQDELQRKMIELLEAGYDTIIFAHRAKSDKKNDFEQLNRELIPYYATDRAIKEIRGSQKTIHIVSLNSVAALKLNLDINLNYHVTKAATLQAALGIALNQKRHKVTSNIILFGEIEDESLAKHCEEKRELHDVIKKYTTSQKIATYESVIDIVRLLATRRISAINRQIIRIDEGIEEVSIESVMRVGIVK